MQHALTLWERKLVEVFHRWTHPEIWIGFKRRAASPSRQRPRKTTPAARPPGSAMPPSAGECVHLGAASQRLR